MAVDDFNKPQSQSSELVAELISALQVRGRIGKLDISDVVSPVYLVDGSATQLPGLQGEPVFLPAEIFSGSAIAPGVSIAIVDTGQLPAGTYDLKLYWQIAIASGNPPGFLSWQHRDAANAANIWTQDIVASFDVADSWSFATTLQTNERIRLLTRIVFAANDRLGASVLTHLRPA